LLEIIGEAATRVPREVRDAHPKIPWHLATGMRNRLIHGYDLVEVEIIFDTVRDDLPLLVAEFNAILPTQAD
jgi:uncharacterized protein with HEPN domain